jgi:hypothetical protein
MKWVRLASATVLGLCLCVDLLRAAAAASLPSEEAPMSPLLPHGPATVVLSRGPLLLVPGDCLFSPAEFHVATAPGAGWTEQSAAAPGQGAGPYRDRLADH